LTKVGVLTKRLIRERMRITKAVAVE